MKKKEKQDCEKLKELNQKKLVDAINKASEVINNANRNQAEYIVVSPQVADVLNETFKNIERKRKYKERIKKIERVKNPPVK